MSIAEKITFPTPADIMRARQQKQSALAQPTEYVDYFAAPFVDEISNESVEATVDADVITTAEATETTSTENLLMPHKEPVETHSSELAATAINLIQVPTEPQDIKVARKDFVKQQEGLFGANDDIKPEDVPEGELTYEQYLAQRPVAQDGDFYHENGRIHDAVTGNFAKKDTYASKLDNSDASEHNEKLEIQASQVEAIKENEFENESNDSKIRTNIEGEFLVQKDARLRGLLSIGEEMLALYNSKLTGEEFEKTVKPVLEEKKASYDALYDVYAGKGLDSRALSYINDKTAARVEKPDFISTEGSAYINGDKVAILDFTETSDNKKAYTIEKADGSIEAVNTSDVIFKREFEKYEAPEIESEEKLSRFERTKKWFSKERQKIQEFGGLAYMGNAFSGALGKAGEWLTDRHITEEMTPEQIQSQKLINRRNNILGLAAGVVVGMLVQKTGVMLFESLTPPSTNTVDALGLGENGYRYPAPTLEVGYADGSEFVPHLPEAASGLDAGGVNNPAYDIPRGGGGIKLFDDLSLSQDKWKEHAQELVDRFPASFKVQGNDIRIVQPGMLPLDVRQAIESFKNS